ncbi:probable ubiquitin carboxyl-terminal hydrolase MINDY-4 isoform X3 [Uloborus diversus]|uniref:probable ubiquitin carboxyl-terminal hydrolase MINDY-4 isoform X3 n=1 Tax=Uloborus diversus TaxID=327109 RepID=UPI0024095E2F|nr:probable ubiquitin carboxyl-terminal hydrolase MINDY-4 isoform X3 [Uloborus diversus]
MQTTNAGPCGVLAAVQANVLLELLFGSSNIPLDSGLLRPKLIDKRRALSQALCSILWQAGEKKSAVYAVRRKTAIIDDNIAENVLKKDGLLEYLHLKYFKSKDDLLEYLYNYISEMMKNDCESCVLFLYSVILTHGIEKIKKEMDVPESHLIGNDGYCSQEIVNLLLTGKAVANLFDGDLELNLGGPEKSLLRGISKRSKIGLLSSYEYKNTCAVGQFYKNPLYPIWLLLGESHFTVLFGTNRDILKKTNAKDPFLLFHYDGLLKKNDKETIFIINPIGRLEEEDKDKTDNSVLQCIYTRWPLASIEKEKEKE